jgi:hypothetical protein
MGYKKQVKYLTTFKVSKLHIIKLTILYKKKVMQYII